MFYLELKKNFKKVTTWPHIPRADMLDVTDHKSDNTHKFSF